MKQSPLFSGLMVAMVFMLLGTLLTSLLMLATNLQENSLYSYTMSIHGIAMLIGGITAGKRSGSKGWYHGGLLGMVYACIVWTIGFLAYDIGLTTQVLYLVVLTTISGALGGMLGIHLKK
ncbi:TIGR04086 family membrane protein [Paenibacillus agricola]|uniref:TIGR04086 family membrane protein n=1 Tax=Paenibacillus agricola TaxID=2716264 RepID=A0ABX0J184_9BACL|nr:TIGR04086 family membrane protein [Paenibacillus agricola]NHN30067.1 TIGR04086 family membrane protein [Paenibacillus agricola]